MLSGRMVYFAGCYRMCLLFGPDICMDRTGFNVNILSEPVVRMYNRIRAVTLGRKNGAIRLFIVRQSLIEIVCWSVNLYDYSGRTSPGIRSFAGIVLRPAVRAGSPTA